MKTHRYFFILLSTFLYSFFSLKDYRLKNNHFNDKIKHTHFIDFSESYKSLELDKAGLSQHIFELAMNGADNLKKQSVDFKDNIITIIDFSKPSNTKRLYVIDLIHKKVLFNTYVAHGKNSGQLFANSFSNTNSSLKSSLGFYETGKTYIGKHGYSLELFGLENGINDNAHERGIVIHPAEYVSEQMIKKQGRCGRSWGCPALPVELSNRIIDQIKNGSLLFIYGIDDSYLNQSKLLKA